MTASSAPASQNPAALSPAATEDSRAQLLDTAFRQPVPSSPGCDPADQLFASMFTGLTDAALANSGIDREAFLAAMAGDRETLKRYLEALGIAVDDAQLDALIGANLPGASGLPLDATPHC
jgi:hypothetical protein